MFNSLNNFINKMLVISTFFILFLSILVIPVTGETNQYPDLLIESIDYEKKIIKDKETEIEVKIKNIGDKNITNENLEIYMFLDDSIDPLVTKSIVKTIDIGGSIYLNFSWITNFADNKNHVVKIVLNYRKIFYEKNYDNNIAFYNIVVNRNETDLNYNDIIFEDQLLINQSSIVKAKILNIGESTEEKITAKLFSEIDGLIDEKTIYGLNYNESYTFNLNWNPYSIGIHKLNFLLYLEDDIQDNLTLNQEVIIGDFDWWDENWHYRSILALNGTGNFSKYFNFTKILNDIGISNMNFENETINIIKYSSNGEILYNIENFTFNESKNYDKTNNATGNLNWKVEVDGNYSFYLVYFDFEENIGQRTKVNDTEILDISPDIDIIYDKIHETWFAEKQPFDTNTQIVGEEVNISLLSVAEIESVDAYAYLKTDNKKNFSFYLNNSGDNLSFVNDSVIFYYSGDWIINFTCTDALGYNYNFLETIYVDQSDLKIIDLDLSVDDLFSPKYFYKNDIINFSLIIKSYYSSFFNVNITMSIKNTKTNDLVYSKYDFFDILEDQEKNINFIWVANSSGSYNIRFFVDSEDNYSEKSESNNILEKKIYLYDLPKIYVKDLTFSSFEIDQNDEVKFDIYIANDEDNLLKECLISLFIEEIKGNNPIMNFKNEIDFLNFEIENKSSKKVSLFWDNATPGDWFVAAKLYIDNNSNNVIPLNHFYFSKKSLSVRAEEKVIPIIKEISISPNFINLGDKVKINALIYDISGINDVSIKIKTPSNDIVNDKMFRSFEDNFIYIYDIIDEIGSYEYEIIAVDNSENKNSNSKKGTFTVGSDNVNPIIYFGDVKQKVQKIDREIDFICIAEDNIEINQIKLRIYTPNNKSIIKSINERNDRFIYNMSFNTTGKYSFKIEVFDSSTNKAQKSGVFWITNDINDSDSDKIPDSWEEEYNLDKYNASDADLDFDSDGYSNYEEYKMNTNPRKNIILQNIAANIKDNIAYLVISVSLFIAIIFLAYFAKRRVFG